MINYTNVSGIPQVLVQWLMEDKYDGYTTNPNSFSATGLIISHKKAILTNAVRASMDISVDVDVLTLMAAKRGTAVHDSIELYISNNQDDMPHVKAEERHYRTIEVDGVECTVSAKFDCIVDDEIYDWKTCSVYVHNDAKKHQEWIEQLSINRWVLEHTYALQPVGTIIAFFNQFSKDQANKSAPFNYPSYSIQPYNFALMSYSETENFIRRRIRERKAIASVADANAITCTPADLWTENGEYKYFSKATNSRATKVSSNLAELRKLVREKGGIIVEPMPKACEYCLGRATCDQYQGFISRGLLDATKSF